MMAFVTASAGAVFTDSSKDIVTKRQLITGYIQNGSPTNCVARIVDCSLTGSVQLCMSMEITQKQVYAKNNLGQCVIELYKNIH